MNAPTDRLDWSRANHALLCAEFAWLRCLLSGQHPAVAEAGLRAARAALAQPAAIDTLCETFGLSAFERALLLLAAGVEMDGALAAGCAEAQGPPQRPWATFGLALAVLPGAHWSALAPARPLRRWRLLEADEHAGLSQARLRIDERVLHHLAGVDHLNPRLEPLLRPVDAAPALMARAHAQAAQALAGALAAADAPLPLVQLHGDDPDGREDVAAACAARLGLRLHALEAGDAPAALHEAAALATLWEREAALQGGALWIEAGGEQPGASALRLAERVNGLVFLGLEQPLALRRAVLRHAVERPAPDEQRRLWALALGDGALESGAPGEGGAMGEALDAVAAQFRFSARAIGRIAAAAKAGAGTAGAAPADRAAALWQACREAAPVRLDGLAQRIEPAAGWDDLVLPEAQLQALRQIAAHVRHRRTVYQDWGFAAQGARGLGVAALFAGESGTGKTMAAEVLARELALDLHRIDLAAVVSKYIGETEKNLKRVFDAAEDTGALLLFDEADALFGKRSEVRDSHDRYANIEVSYLLQRMEAYRGLAILTTNHREALDEAFLRRLRFVVSFPFPEAAEREAIWRRAFPAAAPVGELAWSRLARLQASGGQIRNIALGAAFRAAEAGVPVGMAQLLQAARLEAAKRERALPEGEIRGWV